MRTSDNSCQRAGPAGTGVTGTFLLLIPVTVFAQSSGGAIRGTITNTSGGVIQNARVTIIEVGTTETRRLVSSSAGLYDAPNLAVGTYKLTVTAAGFSTGERAGIEIRVGSERLIDAELAGGSAEQTVTATSDAETVDLATLQAGGIETGKVLTNVKPVLSTPAERDQLVSSADTLHRGCHPALHSQEVVISRQFHPAYAKVSSITKPFSPGRQWSAERG